MPSGLLFPHQLSISTPRSAVGWAGYEVPPEAFSALSERPIEVVSLISGRSIVRTRLYDTVRRIRIVSPEGFVLPGPRAGVLKDLEIGDVCTIYENLSSRTVLTSWVNAIVSAAPIITRIAYDPASGEEFYSYQLEFFHTETT